MFDRGDHLGPTVALTGEQPPIHVGRAMINVRQQAWTFRLQAVLWHPRGRSPPGPATIEQGPAA